MEGVLEIYKSLYEDVMECAEGQFQHDLELFKSMPTIVPMHIFSDGNCTFNVVYNRKHRFIVKRGIIKKNAPALVHYFVVRLLQLNESVEGKLVCVAAYLKCMCQHDEVICRYINWANFLAFFNASWIYRIILIDTIGIEKFIDKRDFECIRKYILSKWPKTALDLCDIAKHISNDTGISAEKILEGFEHKEEQEQSFDDVFNNVYSEFGNIKFN